MDGYAQALDLRLASFLATSPADVGRPTAYLFLDPVKPGDPFQQIRGQRRRAGLVVLEYLAPEMRPAGDFPDPTARIELVVTGIGVGLKKTGKVLELGLRMDAAAIGREPVPDQSRTSGTRCAIIDDIGPQPCLRGLALARHQHRHGRIVGV
ncbi:hypothetical protein BV96_04064 [Sphingomonas paucimobilis]|nr:hypothetical protein BV96_04064 [Sphingomonas paucimobilis]